MKRLIWFILFLPAVCLGQTMGNSDVGFSHTLGRGVGLVGYSPYNQEYNLYDLNYYYSNHSSTPIYFPTFVSNDSSAIHPYVIDFYAEHNLSIWNSYPYWMTFTPLPSVNPDANENPSIVASNDGITFVVPSGLTNPIKNTPPVSYNSDPCLFYENDTLWCCYRTWKGANQACIECKGSADGITWNDSVTLIQLTDLASLEKVVSPSIIKDGGYYYMYAVIRETAGVYPVATEKIPFMRRLRSTNLHTPFVVYDTVTIDATNTKLGEAGNISPGGVYSSGACWYPWHIEVKKLTNKYIMPVYVRSNSVSYQRMYLAESLDGKNFNLAKYSLMSSYNTAMTGFWDEGFYKFSITPYLNNDSLNFNLWYSGWAGHSDTYPVYVGKSTIQQRKTMVSLIKGGNTVDSVNFNEVMDSAIALQGNYVLGDKFNRTVTDGFGTSNSGYTYTYGTYNYFKVTPNYGYSQYASPRPEVKMPAHKDYELRFTAEQIATDWIYYLLKYVDANNYIGYLPYSGNLNIYRSGNNYVMRIYNDEMVAGRNDYKITFIGNTVTLQINGSKAFSYTFTVGSFTNQTEMDSFMNSTDIRIWINNTNWKLHSLTMKSFD